jgi:hypothetical protein
VTLWLWLGTVSLDQQATDPPRNLTAELEVLPPVLISP